MYNIGTYLPSDKHVDKYSEISEVGVGVGQVGNFALK